MTALPQVGSRAPSLKMVGAANCFRAKRAGPKSQEALAMRRRHYLSALQTAALCAVLAVHTAACGDSSNAVGTAGSAAPAAGTGTPPVTPPAGGAGTTGTSTSPVSAAGTSA